MSLKISSDTLLKRNENLFSSEVGGRVVLLMESTGDYFTLDHVGSEIWVSLSKPATLENIVDILLGLYDVSPEQCHADTKAFAEDLISKGVLHHS